MTRETFDIARDILADIDSLKNIKSEYENGHWISFYGVVGIDSSIHEAIYNGIPLPKEHGDLKDMDDIYEALEGWDNDTGWIVDAIDCQAKTILESRKEFKAWLERLRWNVKRADELARELEQIKGTTKNDLGVDCISRQAVLDLINADWKYENLETEINDLPSVTPQEPFINKPCVSEKVCEHDKQMVLDKIRAEIDNALSDGMIHKKTVIGILDKHISGKEET